MIDKSLNIAAPGSPGSIGHPMTVEQLEKFISDANGGAEVKVKGYRELSPIEIVIMETSKLKEATENGERMTTGLRINHSLSNALKLDEALHQSLKDINRVPQKIFEDRGRGLFLALDQDGCLWFLDKSAWIQIKEPGYPDLPRKEI